ncbi:MAG: hypothetical protein ACE5I7_12510, partial [Candidatus Binatia bacterium]
MPTQGSEERVEARYTLAQEDRLLLFSDNPVRVTVLDTTSGVVENRIPLGRGRTGMLAERPLPLPDGRIVVSLRTQAQSPRTGWETSYELFLIDPSRRADRAVLWSYAPPRDGQRRRLHFL